MTQIDYLIINDMTKLGSLVVGKKNQITVMGILNISPESVSYTHLRAHET